MVGRQHDLCEYPIDRNVVEAGARNHMNFAATRRAPTRVGSVGKQHDDRMTAGSRYVRGAGVVPDREKSRGGKVSEVRKAGTTDEIDCTRAIAADLGCQRLLSLGTNDDG